MVSFRRLSDAGFASYAAVGATARDLPAGFNVDHDRVRLGVGAACYRRAVTSIRSWKMFDLGWLAARPERGTIETGMTVGALMEVECARSSSSIT